MFKNVSIVKLMVPGSFQILILPNLDVKLILFGILHDQDQQKVKNHIMLSFKKFLYEKRLCPDKVNVHAFKSHLKRIIQIEYFIAKKIVLWRNILKNGNG